MRCEWNYNNRITWRLVVVILDANYLGWSSSVLSSAGTIIKVEERKREKQNCSTNLIFWLRVSEWKEALSLR